MDVFKLTFETTIVGISAFLWLGIAIQLVSPNSLARAKSFVGGVNQTVAGAVLLSCAYCLGSAILPISDQLVNDEHWLLPESAIRCRVLLEENIQLRSLGYRDAVPNLPEAYPSDCRSAFWKQVFPTKNKAGTKPTRFLLANYGQPAAGAAETEPGKEILTAFELSQSRTLGQGSEKEELFKQLRERVTVLRGVFFSGFVAFLMCVFGCIAPHPEQLSNWLRRSLGLSLALVLIAVVTYTGYKDLTNNNIFDMPILESVVCTIAIFGGFLAIKGVRRPRFLRVHFVVAVALCMGLSYGGWMWSEIVYDQQVISSSAILQGMPEGSSVRQVASGSASSELESADGVDQVPEAH